MQADDSPEDTAPRADTAGPDHPRRYAIRVQGHLGRRWSAWFDGLALSTEDDGTTVIHGPVTDQAALHGLLQKLRDAGITLLALTETPSDAPASEPPRLRHPEGT